MIEAIRVRRFALPLSEPYKLAFGPVAHFDTLLVEATTTDGTGIGEATLLNGYTDETIEQSYDAMLAAAARLPGLPADAGRRQVLATVGHLPFTATALVTALEMAAGHPLLQAPGEIRVPVLAGLNATDEAGIVREIEAAVSAGFATLKIKVGFDVVHDLPRVALIQRVNAGRLRLRVDGNQGYDVADAVAFARSLDPGSIELLEQPCDAGDWAAAEAVARVSTVPLMLDESIYGIPDIERAAAVGAKYVKLKLMKFASLDLLAEGLERIRSLGMTPILGNGVATETGCWMEAMVAHRHVATAGEMNGFRRLASPTVRHPMTVQNGTIVIPEGYSPQLDDEVLTRHALAEVRFGKQRGQRATA